jgi:predicted MarR family transcription regulator
MSRRPKHDQKPKAESAKASGRTLGPIVSSAHLAAGSMPALSEFEFGLILCSNAFHRCMVRTMAAAGIPDLSAMDVLVLHNVNHRSKPKKLADICLVLNIEDTHIVSYALKKLERLKLVKSGRAGKEKIVSVTAEGAEACTRYGEIREMLLVRAVKDLGLDERRLSEFAGEMRALSGHYDQAARAAASL